jgi:hypothetical protein
MMMDDYKNSDNFQGMVGCKMISPHQWEPLNVHDDILEGCTALLKSL